MVLVLVMTVMICTAIVVGDISGIMEPPGLW